MISKKLMRERELKRASLLGAVDRVTDFASTCLAAKVEALLDDPHGVLGDDRGLEYIDELRQLAVDLGDDFDALLSQGTEFERERLRKLMVEKS